MLGKRNGKSTTFFHFLGRTIFRWITVKNLNTMQFDDTVRTDTPMGLLRGIKHGTESYHVLFKRICRYDDEKYISETVTSTHCINENFAFPVWGNNAATPVCIALSSRAIQNRPATSQAYASRTTASAIRGTPSMWPEPGVSSSATGAPAIWSMLKKCPNLEARANPTVFGNTSDNRNNSPELPNKIHRNFIRVTVTSTTTIISWRIPRNSSTSFSLFSPNGNCLRPPSRSKNSKTFHLCAHSSSATDFTSQTKIPRPLWSQIPPVIITFFSFIDCLHHLVRTKKGSADPSFKLLFFPILSVTVCFP